MKYTPETTAGVEDETTYFWGGGILDQQHLQTCWILFGLSSKFVLPATNCMDIQCYNITYTLCSNTKNNIATDITTFYNIVRLYC